MTRAAVAALALAGVLGAQDRAAAAAPTPQSRQDAVLVAAARQAAVATERQGKLFLRDLVRHCGVDEKAADQLGTPLFAAIEQWVEAHPPREYGTYEADFDEILAKPVWVDGLNQYASPEARQRLGALDADRRKRLAAAATACVLAIAAAELRLTPAQSQALEPACRRIGDQYVKFNVARPTEVVVELDRSSARVLTAVQTGYPMLLATSKNVRDARVEFALECERIRLLLDLDEPRAQLLRACGEDAGQRVASAAKIADAAAGKAAADAKEKEKEKSAATGPTKPFHRLPDQACLRDAFWTKVRDSLLTDAEKATLAAAPAPSCRSIAAARVDLTLAKLDLIFHLDPAQCDALRPLAEKVVEQDLKNARSITLDVITGFGIGNRGETSPEERAAARALEDVLDRTQFEVLKDRIGP